MYGIIDGQMQRVHLRASIRIRVAVGVVATDGVFRPVPRETLTNGFGDGSVYGVIDGEVQRDNGVATSGIRQREGRSISALRIGYSVDPSEGLAGGLFVNAGSGVIDGEVQRDNGVAAGRVREGLRIGARFRVGFAIPGITFACHICEICVICVRYSEVQGDNRVATIFQSKSLLIIATLGVCLIVPSIAIASRMPELGNHIRARSTSTIIRLITTQVNDIIFDTRSAVQVETFRNESIITHIDARRTLLKVPVHIFCAVGYAGGEGRIDKQRRIEITQSNVVLAFIAAFDGGISAGDVT